MKFSYNESNGKNMDLYKKISTISDYSREKYSSDLFQHLEIEGFIPLPCQQ